MKKLNGLDCILLVDDDNATNFFNEILIKKLGLELKVQATSNGREALEFLTCTGKFETQNEYPQPGLILLDINMPVMNGWEFLDEYRKLPENKKAKIVLAVLTTSMNPDDEARANNNEATNGFLRKPISLQQMEEIINKYYPVSV